ncbi:hypothetical protein [Eubacterium pyruvativorans]|uniref:hypothetical protein n=1 Tax=Eubacterium pyruvativorans TaxID=155865 RepID=UPI0015A703F8|nr:hypothetical protein [Eubacterium pyruvativorans]
MSVSLRRPALETEWTGIGGETSGIGGDRSVTDREATGGKGVFLSFRELHPA